MVEKSRSNPARPPELEKFLSGLEHELSDLSPSERATIIDQVRAEALELHSQSSVGLQKILDSLGSPYAVATRRRLEHGLPVPARPKRKEGNWLKWTLAAFVAGLLLLGFSAYMLIQSFTPVVNVDDETGRIRLFGGRVEIDSEKGEVNVAGQTIPLQSSSFMRIGNTVRIGGSLPVGEQKTFRLSARDGTYRIRAVDAHRLSYNCEVDGETSAKTLNERFIRSANEIQLTLRGTGPDALRAASCSIAVPETLMLDIQLDNGLVELSQTHQEVRAEVQNGMIFFTPADYNDYKIDSHVQQGVMNVPEPPEGSPRTTATLRVGNGTLSVFD